MFGSVIRTDRRRGKLTRGLYFTIVLQIGDVRTEVRGVEVFCDSLPSLPNIIFTIYISERYFGEGCPWSRVWTFVSFGLYTEILRTSDYNPHETTVPERVMELENLCIQLCLILLIFQWLHIDTFLDFLQCFKIKICVAQHGAWKSVQKLGLNLSAQCSWLLMTWYMAFRGYAKGRQKRLPM